MTQGGGVGAGAPPGVDGPIKGRVSGLQQRFEAGGEAIWNFRVERQDDAGQPLPRVAVEMHGVGFEGALNEGDWVQVAGTWDDGTLHVTDVQNLSTQATVRAKRPRVAKALGIALVALIAVGVVVLILVAALGGDSGDSEQGARQRRQDDFERRSEQDRDRTQREFCRQAPNHPNCR
jgi:hypothetical protein